MAFVKFEDMEVWKKGHALVLAVYRLTAGTLFRQDRGLCDQIQRAAVSITSNIAEGYARRGNKEFVKFLWIAKGSAAEIQSQLYVARALGYVSQDQFDRLYSEANLIQVQLFHLIQSLATDINRQKV